MEKAIGNLIVEGLYQTDTVKLAKPLRQIYSVENRARVRSGLGKSLSHERLES